MSKITPQVKQSTPPDDPDRWSWVEHSVWTARMLNALEPGVKGGKWHSLIDKVYNGSNLNAAYQRVASNHGSAGVDGISLERYHAHLEHHQSTLARQLQAGSYQPGPIRRTYISKSGSSEKRPLGIPTVRDRIVQTALKHVLEPIFEHTFHDSSYGFRPQRSCQDALQAVDQLMREGYQHVVDADIQGYFDHISHSILLSELRSRLADGRVLDLLEAYLHQDIFDGLHSWTPDEGSPQGAVISPLLANVFLNPFDWYIHSLGLKLVRYADDFIILCHSAAEAQKALDRTRTWMSQHQLTLHPGKTRVVDMTQHGSSFTFLGYTFFRHVNQQGQSRLHKRPGDKALRRVKGSIRAKTPRTSGKCLPCIIQHLNQSLRGWHAYYRHSMRSSLTVLDSMIRRRLRRLLRKRLKRRHGSGRALSDHQRWPNSFFAAAGLFSLAAAHCSVTSASSE